MPRHIAFCRENIKHNKNKNFKNYPKCVTMSTIGGLVQEKQYVICDSFFESQYNIMFLLDKCNVSDGAKLQSY